MKECKCIVSITDPSDKDRFVTVLETELAEYAKTNDYLARKAKKLEAELEKAEVDFAELHEKYAMLLDKGITRAEEARAELADLYKDRDKDFYGYTTCSKCACYYIDKDGGPPSSADPTCTPCAETEWLNIKLAELREVVAWYLECCDTICSFSDRKLVCNNTLLCYEKAPKLLPKSCPACNSMDEIWKNKRRAEQELRLAGGEDV